MSAIEVTIDLADGKACRGWAYDPANPGASIDVHITSGGKPVATCRAARFRADLLAAGKGDGFLAFEADISGGEFADGFITVTASDGSGHTASTTVALHPPPPGLAVTDYLRQRPWRDEYRAVMAAALRRRRPDPLARFRLAERSGGGYPSRADPEKLFAPPPELAGAGRSAGGHSLITSYLAYECYRTRMDEQLDLHGDTLDQLRVIDWYLTTYLGHRRRKLPLSDAQITALNAVLPMLAHPRRISVVSASFIARELGSHWNLADPAISADAIYWWCVERAPELKVQDSLIPDYYVEHLVSTGPAQRWLQFHTNRFVDRYHAVHPALQFLDLNVVQDRALLAAYMVALCGNEPVLVRFLPREAVSRLLAPARQGSGTMLLDDILQAALEPQSPPYGTTPVQAAGPESQPALPAPPVGSADHGEPPPVRPAAPATHDIGTSTRDALLDAISSAGYSLKLGRRMAGKTGGHVAECLDQPGPIGPPSPGVALIGPLRAASGLGQATRLSAKVLRLLDPDLTVNNFDMDNPAPTEFIQHDREEDSRSRAINLIHLNAESIPLAFAFLPQQLYRRSYNIGFFFWELTELPKCHRLALELLDEIWVASEYDREIYAANTGIPVRNVGMAVEPLPSQLPSVGRAQFGIPAECFVVMATFDSFSFLERKNPMAVVRAFQLAFPSSPGRHSGERDVMLLLKTHNRHKVDDPHQVRLWNRILQACARDPRIIILNDTLPYAELLALKQDMDCYISLHRSEGWGFGLVEAMQLGVPVIATGYSGNMEFCNAETAMLVGYKLVEPRSDEYIFVERGSLWAEPSVEEAAAHLRTAYADPAHTRAMAARAQAMVRESFSPEAIALRYGSRLAEISAIVSASEGRMDD